MFDSPLFVRICGKWHLKPMMEDQDVETFTRIGKELQKQIDTGHFDKPNDVENFQGWIKMKQKFDPDEVLF